MRLCDEWLKVNENNMAYILMGILFVVTFGMLYFLEPSNKYVIIMMTFWLIVVIYMAYKDSYQEVNDAQGNMH
jgi:preprotein translocase subunit SecG